MTFVRENGPKPMQCKKSIDFFLPPIVKQEMMSTTKKKNQKEFGPENKPAVLLHQETGFRWVTYIGGGIAALLILFVIFRIFYVKKPITIGGGGGEAMPSVADLSAISEVSSDVLTNLSQL